MADQILKKEDKLTYKGGFLKNKKGSLALTRSNLYFVSKKGDKVFDIPLADIVSINAQKGVGAGVEHLYVLYNRDGKEKKLKIEHFSMMSWGMGLASRISASYFASWEQMINDARFNKIS